MHSNSVLLRWCGFCAVAYGICCALSYIAYIVGVGYPPLSISRLNPPQIISIYLNPGVNASLVIDCLSYLFLFPALVGMRVHLKRIRPGLSAIGFTFGMVGSIVLMISSFMLYGASDLLVKTAGANLVMFENMAVLLHTVSGYLQFLILPLIGTFYLMWGFSFRSGPRPDRIVGNSLIIAFLFLLAAQLAITWSLKGVADTSLMLKVLMVSASFIMAGRLLRKDETIDRTLGRSIL